jgi:hypothetical protein
MAEQLNVNPAKYQKIRVGTVVIAIKHVNPADNGQRHTQRKNNRRSKSGSRTIKTIFDNTHEIITPLAVLQS